MGQDAVMSQRELAGGIKCFYYELMPAEDNSFRVMHCFILWQRHLPWWCVLQQCSLEVPMQTAVVKLQETVVRSSIYEK